MDTLTNPPDKIMVTLTASTNPPTWRLDFRSVACKEEQHLLGLTEEDWTAGCARLWVRSTAPSEPGWTKVEKINSPSWDYFPIYVTLYVTLPDGEIRRVGDTFEYGIRRNLIRLFYRDLSEFWIKKDE